MKTTGNNPDSRSTERFGNRAEDYAKFRPGYSKAAIDFLVEHSKITPGSAIADIGAGTGILTTLLLDRGYSVFAVEPNAEMRRLCEEKLAGRFGFSVLSGTAEQTNLPERSVDLVTAAQAFHWFSRAKARAEFSRILRPPGHFALLWNDRKNDANDFMREYEEIVRRHAVDYDEICHMNLKGRDFAEFCEPRLIDQRSFENPCDLDWKALIGRAASQSYMPPRGTPEFEVWSPELRQSYERHAQSGTVRLIYDTRVIAGQLSDSPA